MHIYVYEYFLIREGFYEMYFSVCIAKNVVFTFVSFFFLFVERRNNIELVNESRWRRTHTACNIQYKNIDLSYASLFFFLHFCYFSFYIVASFRAPVVKLLKILSKPTYHSCLFMVFCISFRFFLFCFPLTVQMFL